MADSAEAITGYSLHAAGLTAAQLTAFCDAQWQAAAMTGYLQTATTALWLAAPHADVEASSGRDLVAYYRDPAEQAEPRRGSVATLSWTALWERWPLATIGEGRLFNRQVEWRWQADPQTSGRYTLLGLSEGRDSLQTGQAQLADGPVVIRECWSVSTLRVRLIGSIIDETAGAPAVSGHSWWEVRNPNPLIYPLEHGANRNRQPRLWTKVYADQQTGAVTYTRYSCLELEDVTGVGSDT